MKRMLFMIIPVLCIGMISCNQAPPATPAPAADNGEANKAIVDTFLKAVRGGDIKTAGDQLSDTFWSYGPSIKDSTDRAGFIEYWTKRWETEFDSIGYVRYAQLAATLDSMDWVNEWGHINVTYKNGTPDIHFNYHGAFRLSDGKIVQYIAFYNVADILEQQGFTFVPPAKKEEKKK
ncbi:MAG TPA: hypothetical protein VGK59_23025 [Ohtaekwangia sp.]